MYFLVLVFMKEWWKKHRRRLLSFGWLWNNLQRKMWVNPYSNSNCLGSKRTKHSPKEDKSTQKDFLLVFSPKNKFSDVFVCVLVESKQTRMEFSIKLKNEHHFSSFLLPLARIWFLAGKLKNEWNKIDRSSEIDWRKKFFGFASGSVEVCYRKAFLMVGWPVSCFKCVKLGILITFIWNFCNSARPK